MQYACVWARKGTKRTSEKAQAHPFAWLHSDVRSFYFHNSQLTNSTGLHSLLAHVINKITCVILLCANTCVRACVCGFSSMPFHIPHRPKIYATGVIDFHHTALQHTYILCRHRKRLSFELLCMV